MSGESRGKYIYIQEQVALVIETKRQEIRPGNHKRRDPVIQQMIARQEWGWGVVNGNPDHGAVKSSKFASFGGRTMSSRRHHPLNNEDIVQSPCSAGGIE